MLSALCLFCPYCCCLYFAWNIGLSLIINISFFLLHLPFFCSSCCFCISRLLQQNKHNASPKIIDRTRWPRQSFTMQRSEVCSNTWLESINWKGRMAKRPTACQKNWLECGAGRKEWWGLCVAKKLKIPKFSRPESGKIDEKTKHTWKWFVLN